MASWEQLGELSTVDQLTGLGAARLIALIVQAATTARMHKKNCRQFAQHLKLIGNLLEQLKISEFTKYPETREPLERLEDALRRSYILVDSCQNRSYLYLLAMGWNIVYQFRRAQTEIDRYLQIVPLITLVDNARVRERLEAVARDEREYTLDEEDRKVQDAILDRDPSTNHAAVLQKSFTYSYPNMPFDKALEKEREKLQIELQKSHDIDQFEMIQHLIGVTQNVASTLEEKCAQLKSPKKVDLNHSGANSYNENTFDNDNYEKDTKTTSREGFAMISCRIYCVVAVPLFKNAEKWRFVVLKALGRQEQVHQFLMQQCQSREEPCSVGCDASMIPYKIIDT
ncbi:PLAC8 family [Musa troglodytarum]|uniref:PLAC8 family n=1 Tax=Musa troglodytarum TaxID=320322 RepID=A0A9E7GM74_9LILI|nr:PLAC8 family [Musa troglodytarum]